MNLYVAGEGPVRLGAADFAGQGGEASVYLKGERAYKVYTDPGRALPESKLQELAVLELPTILRPEALLLDGGNRPVGYAMRRVRDATPLCRVFSRAFRERRGLSPDAVFDLVKRLQAGVRHVHQQGLLVVDLNETNFLLDAALREVLFIDVDSYQTPSFPATALMDSVRDRHAAGFSEATDWFSFAVVSFQLLVGVHPYRGKHPTLSDLDARMRANASVLDPGVVVPVSCYPFSIIPPAYLEWYRSVLDEGERLPPPDPATARIRKPAPYPPARSAGELLLRELHRFPADVLDYLSGTPPVALTPAGVYAGPALRLAGSAAALGRTPRLRHAVAATCAGGEVRIRDLDADAWLPGSLAGQAITRCGERLIVHAGATLYEVEFVEVGSRVTATPRPVGNALEHATQLFEGVAIQNLLGAQHACLFPRPGECRTVRLPELDGCRVLDAAADGIVLFVVCERGGGYDRLRFRFETAFSGYDVVRQADGSPGGCQIATLPQGVALALGETEELEVFSARPGSPAVRQLNDPALAGARLLHDGPRALLARGPVVYEMRLAARD